MSETQKHMRTNVDQEPNGRLGMVVRFVVVLVLCFLTSVLRWGMGEWGNLTMNEILFTLSAPLEGTSGDVWREIVQSFLPYLGAVLVVFLPAIIKGGKVARRITWAALAVAAVLTGVSGWGAYQSFGVEEYVRSQTSTSTFVDDNYVNPNDVEVTFPEQKRNLIYIYLESMEVTFADEANGGAFEQNVIPNLTQIAHDNECFSGDDALLNGGYSLYNTTWTMSGMVAQTAGVPLSTGLNTNDMLFQSAFAPDLVTVGDILEDNGYTNAFLLGSVSGFGGRRLYFGSHGDYEIWDYGYSLANGEIPEGYRVWWGYEDARLFEFAQNHLRDLAAAEEPFNLTILTVDTHREDGYVCEDCPTTFGDNQYANVMNCSDKRVADFISWVQQQDFYENTTIILCGDHITMDSNFCEDVPEDYGRRTYTTVINAPVTPQTDEFRTYSTMDLFPTTLAALGVSIEGDRLGLGTNLFSDRPTLIEEYGIDEVNLELQAQSDLLTKLLAVNLDLKPEVTAEPLEEGERYEIHVHATLQEDTMDELFLRVYAKDKAPSERTVETVSLDPALGGYYTAIISADDVHDGPGEYVVQLCVKFKDGTTDGVMTSATVTFN